MKISADTIARTIVLFIAILNQILAILGKNRLEIAESDIYQIVTLVFTIGSAVWAWWKNNSFTQNALKADEFMKELKDIQIRDHSS